MCRPASFIVTKKQVFWSKISESHESIIGENELKEMDVRNKPTFIRVEIVPLDNDYRLSFKKWFYRLNQDIKPSWYDASDVERRCRQQLKEWRKCKIIMPTKETNVKNGEFIITNYGTVNDNHGTVSYNSGTVNSNYGTVNNNSGTVNDNHNTVDYNSGTVDNNYGTVNDNSGTVGNNSGTVDDNHGTVSYNSGTVNSNYGTVKKCTGNSTVTTYVKLDKGILQSANAVLIDRSGDSPKCYIGSEN